MKDRSKISNNRDKLSSSFSDKTYQSSKRTKLLSKLMREKKRKYGKSYRGGEYDRTK